MVKLFLMIFLSSFLLQAQPMRSDSSVTARVGYLKGLLPSLSKVHQDLQNAKTVTEQRFAATKALTWSFLYTRNEQPKRELTINHTSVIRSGFDLLEKTALKFADERRQAYDDDSAPDPSFEKVKSIIEKMHSIVLDEVNNPDLVDAKLPIYEESMKLSLKFTLGFFYAYAEYPHGLPDDTEKFLADLTWIQKNLRDAEHFLIVFGFNLKEVFQVYHDFSMALEAIKPTAPTGKKPLFFGKKEYEKQLFEAVSLYNYNKNSYYSRLEPLKSVKSCKAVAQ